MVQVRPRQSCRIGWWPTNARGQYVFVCVVLSDGDAFGGYVTLDALDASHGYPITYVKRVRRLWCQEYPARLKAHWVFRTKLIGEEQE